MVKEKMSVHKALVEIKLAESKLERDLNTQFIAVNKHMNTKIEGVVVDDYKKNIVAAYDKLNDDTKRTMAIKQALSKSNAETVVKIAGKDYRVSEAIWMKDHGIGILERQLDVFISQYVAATTKLEVNNGERLDAAAEKYVTAMFGTKEKANNADIEDAMRKYRENNAFDLVDPIGLSKKIEELKAQIEGFKSDFDSAIQTSNAVTEITIEY